MPFYSAPSCLTRHGKLVNARIGAHFCNALHAKVVPFFIGFCLNYQKID